MTTGLRTRAAKRRLEWAPSHDDHCRFRVSLGSGQCNCGLEDDLRMVEEEERARYAAVDVERLARAIRVAGHGGHPEEWQHLDWGFEWYDTPREMAEAIAREYAALAREEER